MTDRTGTLKHAGGATLACPACRGMVATALAASCTQVEGGLRFTGVPCSGCSLTYTVEMLATDSDADHSRTEVAS